MAVSLLGPGKTKKSGSGFGISILVERDFSSGIPENPDPEKIPALYLRDPGRDSGFFQKIKIFTLKFI